MLEPITLVIIGLLVTYLAGVIYGMTGFGFPLISVPVLTIFLSPKIIVPVITIDNAFIDLVLLFEAKKLVDLKKVGPLMIAGLVGMPLGAFLLMALDVSVIKLYIGSVITIFAIALLMGFRRIIKNEKLAFAPVGFVGGVLGGSTSISGPPVILFFTNQGVKMEIFRANLIAYFTALDLATSTTFMFGGLINSTVINYVIIFIPAIILGAITGVKLKPKVKENLFRNMALVVVIIAGLLSIASSLGIL